MLERTQPPTGDGPARRRGSDDPADADPADAAVDAGHAGVDGDDRADTRTRLLDAAERLFGEQTFRSTTLRQITAAAGANIAAVHYHFGSKDELFQAVFHRRVGPINAERIRRLRALLAGRPTPALEDVLRALIEPAAALRASPAGRSFSSLVGRSLSADGPHWKTIEREFEGVKAEFLPVFARLCDHLAPADLAWRLHFGLASLCAVLAGPDRLREATGGRCDPDDVDVAVDQLVTFTAAGLSAPATRSRSHPPARARAERPTDDEHE